MTWRDVQKSLDDFRDKWPGSGYGPAHITLEDGNVSDHNLLFCIRETHLEIKKDWRGKRAAEYAATLDFLIELAGIPESEREEPGQICWRQGDDVTNLYFCYPDEKPETLYGPGAWLRDPSRDEATP